MEVGLTAVKSESNEIKSTLKEAESYCRRRLGDGFQFRWKTIGFKGNRTKSRTKNEGMTRMTTRKMKVSHFDNV